MAKFFHSIFVAVLAMLFLIGTPPLSAQEGDVIESLKIVGNKRIDESTILYYIQSKPGTVLSKNRIRKDIEQIFSLGQFKDIQVDTQSTLKGLELQFIVEEIPSIGNVEILGNSQLETSDIREKIGLRRGATFKEHLVQEAKKEILKAYEEKGYFFAETRIETHMGPDNLVDVAIRIREGKKVKIDKIRFSGNKAFEDNKLAEQMETEAETWYSFIDDSGVYQKDILKLDMFRIEGFYQDHGFLRIKVLEPRIDINKQARQIHITIPVEEGPQFRIKSIEIKGDDTIPHNEIIKSLQTKKGDIYNVSQLREDIITVTDLYSTKGFAYAEANPVTKIDDKTRRVELSIDIDKGKKVYVGKINMLGNIKTKDNVIRREFRLKEGEVFDGSKLKRSKQRINNLNYFEDVKVDTQRGENPELIDILTTVTEKPTGNFTVGAGFSSVENLIFTASIAQNNLFGNGHRVNLTASLSSIRADFNLSLTEPRLFDSEISAGIDLFNTDQDFLSFDSLSTGGGLRLGKNITEYETVTFGYRFNNVEVTGVSQQDTTDFLKNETRTTSRITPTYIYDSRDNFLNPSQGWRHVITSDLAGLGGAKFTRSMYEIIYYRPLIGKLVFGSHGRINYAAGYDGETLPAFERYFMGGPTTLRGFTIQDVGPKDTDGDPVGGSKALLLNLELQYPFTKSLRGFVFYDRGNVFGTGPDLSVTSEDYDLAEMRHSIGAGFRFISPFGPMGFAYGIKLDKQSGEEVGQFHFSAGSAF
ncbi:MAG: outer membrane protein assembly factor BamA [Nitrospinae bacterium]|nr:outer membrane protein assembly factor BamA [Nitrospinota bacterium]